MINKTFLIKSAVVVVILALCFFVLSRIGVQKQTTQQTVHGNNANFNTYNIQESKKGLKIVPAAIYLYDTGDRSHLIGGSLSVEF